MLKKYVIDKIKKHIVNQKLADDIGKTVITNIQGNVRQAKIPDGTGRYKRLAKSTIKYKEYLERGGNATGVSYQRTKPNLTISGQLLESLRSYYSPVYRLIRITPTGIRARYRSLKGKPIGKLLTNKKLVEYQNELGRPIMRYSPRIKKIIVIKIKQHLRRALKK